MSVWYHFVMWCNYYNKSICGISVVLENKQFDKAKAVVVSVVTAMQGILYNLRWIDPICVKRSSPE